MKTTKMASNVVMATYAPMDERTKLGRMEFRMKEDERDKGAGEGYSRKGWSG